MEYGTDVERRWSRLVLEISLDDLHLKLWPLLSKLDRAVLSAPEKDGADALERAALIVRRMDQLLDK